MVNIAKPPSDGSPLPPFPLQVPAMCLCRELIQLLLVGWLVELGGLFVCFFGLFVLIFVVVVCLLVLGGVLLLWFFILENFWKSSLGQFPERLQKFFC